MATHKHIMFNLQVLVSPRKEDPRLIASRTRSLHQVTEESMLGGKTRKDNILNIPKMIMHLTRWKILLVIITNSCKP